MASSNILLQNSAEAIGEDIPKETLISLLKDKSKEIKTMSIRLSKLEEKYVKIFKEHKNLLKDKDVLERFLCKNIFAQPPYQFQPTTDFGLYEYDKICELWTTKEEDKNQSMASIMSLINKEKAELEMKYKGLQDRQSNEQQAFAQISSLKEQIEVYEESNGKLSKEILELNELLAKKNEEMMGYKKLEQEYSQYKAEILLKELNSKSNKNEMLDLKNRFKESEKTNDILRLRQELEECHETIKKLESLNVFPTKEHVSVPETVLFHKEIQTDEVNPSVLLKKKNSIDTFSFNKLMAAVQLDEPPMMNGLNTEKVNHEYLKNVILKYFVYLEGKNYNEANSLMQVILTIMKISKEEKKMIEDARDKASFWNSAKSYLNEALFIGKYRDINYQANHPMKKNGVNIENKN